MQRTGRRRGRSRAPSRRSRPLGRIAPRLRVPLLSKLLSPTSLLRRSRQHASRSLDTSVEAATKVLQEKPDVAPARGSRGPSVSELKAGAKSGAKEGAKEGSTSAKDEIAKVQTDVSKVHSDVKKMGQVVVAGRGEVLKTSLEEFAKAQEDLLKKHAEAQDEKLRDLKTHVTEGFRTACDFIVQQVVSQVQSGIRSALDEDRAGETWKRGPQRGHRMGETPPSASRTPSRRSPRNHESSYRICSDNQETSGSRAGSRAGLTSRDNDIMQVAVAAAVAQSRMSQGQAPGAQQTPNSNPFANGFAGAAGFMPANGMNPSGVGGGANYVASQGMGGSVGVFPQGFAGHSSNNPFNGNVFGRGPYGN